MSILTALPAHASGTVIVQHMPPSSFERRLDSLCNIHVSEARDGVREIGPLERIHQQILARAGMESRWSRPLVLNHRWALPDLL